MSKRLLLLFAGIMIVLGLTYFANIGGWLSLESIKDHYSLLAEIVQQYPWLSVVGYGLLYVLVAALAIPGAVPLTLLGGALFGLLSATVVISLASTLGSTLAFLISRYFFRQALLNRYGDRIRELNRNLEHHGASYLFFLRLNPIIPFFLINSLMGLTPMGTWTFFWVSQIGMLPGTLLYVNAGTQLLKVQSLEAIVSWEILLSFFAIGVFPVIVSKLIRSSRLR